MHLSRFCLAAVAAAAAASAAAPVSAITIRTDRSDNQYLNLGQDLKYRSVGFMTWAGGNSSSAVVISPKWVLTAAHCVDTADVRSMLFNGVSQSDAQHFAHPSWTGSVNSGNDVGLLRATNPITNVIPASLSLVTEVGLVGTSVGYGLTGNGSTGYGGFLQSKRGATNMIDATGDSIGFFSSVIISDFDSPLDPGKSSLGSPVPTDLEGSIAPGDSGGGTFVDIANRWYLVGVHSFTTRGLGSADDGVINSSYSDMFGSTRISGYLFWIDDNIANNWIGGIGTFGNSAQWSMGPSALHAVPDQNDIVGFNATGAYSVTFTSNATNWQILARRGNANVNLGGFTWTATNNNFDGALVVGRTQAAEVAQLSLSNGSFNTTESIVGFSGNAFLQLGNALVWNNSGDVYVGGDFMQQRTNGRINLNSAATPPTVNIAGRLKVYSVGTVNYSAGSLSVGTLEVAGGRVLLSAGNNKVLRVNDVSVTGVGGRVDLTDNKMVVDYTGATTVNSIASLITAGYAGGAWSGTGILTSIGDATHGLGYGDNAILGRSTFGGQSVDSTSVLIGYTFYGDANLDGGVDVTDLGALATNWQTSALWTGGDFDYSGFVDVSDLGKLATNWQAGVVGAALSFEQALAEVGLGGVSVPEPATATGVGLLALASLARRKRA